MWVLEARGRWLLGTALALIGAGLGLGLSGAVLAGVLLVAGLTHELLRLRAALPDAAGQRPWGLHAQLRFDRGGFDDRSVTSHRVGHEIELLLELNVPAEFAGARVLLKRWVASPGVEVDQGLHTLVLREGATSAHLRALPQVAAVHRILGVEARIVDAMGLMSSAIFLPCPCELAVLPRSLPLDVARLAETRRRAPRSAGGQVPDKTPGMGDDLRELGIVVEPMHGIDELVEMVAEFGPSTQRRLGVLVDHLVTGSKEDRLARLVASEHVLVTGHPFVDVWARKIGRAHV